MELDENYPGVVAKDGPQNSGSGGLLVWAKGIPSILSFTALTESEYASILSPSPAPATPTGIHPQPPDDARSLRTGVWSGRQVDDQETCGRMDRGFGAEDSVGGSRK